MLAGVAGIGQGSVAQAVSLPVVDVTEAQRGGEGGEQSGLSLDVSFGDSFLSWEITPQM